MKLPDDMFKQELLPYLSVDDIVNLDNACMNHKYRPQLMEKISGVILLGDKVKRMKASLFKWLGMRRIFLINMEILEYDYYLTSSRIENDYVDQFRYTQHVVMSGRIRDDMAIFILSHCPCLLSIEFSGKCSHPQLTDHTLQSIAEHCAQRFQSLSLCDCREITDVGLITISEHCPFLQFLKVRYCNQITDTSIISISTHCTGLLSLKLQSCHLLTDDSIISISTHCTGLLSLNLEGCRQITDVSIISISTHFTGLQSINLCGCQKITDASIISISSYCTGLLSLNLMFCPLITDVSIISISENCTGMEELTISGTNMTDASLIAIAKNCTEFKALRTYRCNGLSSIKLRDEFSSVSELRAVLLSIYPSLSFTEYHHT